MTPLQCERMNLLATLLNSQWDVSFIVTHGMHQASLEGVSVVVSEGCIRSACGRSASSTEESIRFYLDDIAGKTIKMDGGRSFKMPASLTAIILGEP